MEQIKQIIALSEQANITLINGVKASANDLKYLLANLLLNKNNASVFIDGNILEITTD